MFIASYRKTMAGAKPVEDQGIDLRPERRRRERLIEASRQWRLNQQARNRALARFLAERYERLRALFEREDKGPKPLVLISRVAAWHGLTAEDIIDQSRLPALVAARFDAIAAVFLNCRIDGRSYTLTELGRLFKRDHTTIMWALRKRGLK